MYVRVGFIFDPRHGDAAVTPAIEAQVGGDLPEGSRQNVPDLLFSREKSAGVASAVFLFASDIAHRSP